MSNIANRDISKTICNRMKQCTYVDPDRMAQFEPSHQDLHWLQKSCLIRIYTVCHSLSDFRLKPLFAFMDIARFNDGRLYLRNLRLIG